MVLIKVKSVTVSIVRHNEPPPGQTGDRFELRSRLSNLAPQFGRPTGATVGGDRYTLTFTSTTSWRTAGLTTLPGGTIRWSGRGQLTKGKPVTAIAVTGGTGRFAGARGTVTAKDEGKETADPCVGGQPGLRELEAGRTRLVTAGGDATVRLYNANTGQQVGASMPISHTLFSYVTFSPDGQTIVATDPSGQVWLNPATASGWEASACRVANRALTESEWEKFVPGHIYRHVC